MKKSRPEVRRRQAIVTLAIGSIALAGGLFAFSGSADDQPTSPTAQRLRGLAAVYLDYAVSQGTGPASEQILRKHMGAVPPFVLGTDEITQETIDAIFVSARDSQPFEIRYGHSIDGCKDDGRVVIAFERKGKSGTRLVAFADGGVESVEEYRLDALLLGSF